MSRRGAKRPKWAVTPFAVQIEGDSPNHSAGCTPPPWLARLDSIIDELTTFENRVPDKPATSVDLHPSEAEVRIKDIKDELTSIRNRVLERANWIDWLRVYSVEPKTSLTRKLDSGAHIVVIGPISHVTRRRAKRFSAAEDVVVLVGDRPPPDVSQEAQRPGLALRLALRAMPWYARHEFEQETIATLEDGCVDRSGNRIGRTVWLIRNLMDLVCSGLRLRLDTRPLYCLPIWIGPTPPDHDEMRRFEECLEELLK